jgi:hypothetical protein
MVLFFVILGLVVLTIIAGMVWQTGRSNESFPFARFFCQAHVRNR